MDYLKVFLVLAPQLIAGCLIYLMILKRDEVALVELLSIGGVFGIITSTIFDQIFVNLQLPRIGWLVPLLVVLVVFRIGQNNQAIALPKIQTEQAFRKTILPILAISAAALGAEWFWLFPSGVLFCFAAFLSIAPARTYSRIAIRLTNLAALIAGVIMIANRPKIWWFLYDSDYAFLQGLSRSLADWGINDYFLLSGFQTKYHWFTYAWIGLVDRSSTAATFFVLTRIAPVVFVVLITGVIWSIINRHSVARLRTFASTLVVMTASSYSLWQSKMVWLASPSQIYAFSFLLVSVFLFTRLDDSKIRFMVPVCITIAGATVLAKTMHGVILIVFLGSFFLFEVYLRRRDRWRISILFVCTILSVLAAYAFFISNSEAKNVFEIRPGDFIWQLQGDGRSLPNKAVDLIGLLSIIAFGVLPLSLTFLSATSKQDLCRRTSFVNLGTLSAGMFLSLVILGAFGENLYFIHSAMGLSSTLGFASLSSRSDIKKMSLPNWLLLILFGVAMFVATFLIPSINSGATYAVVLRSMRLFLIPLLFVIIGFAILSVGLFRKRSSAQTLFKVLIVVSATALTFSAKNWHEHISDRHNEFERMGNSYLGTYDIRETAKWVNENTNETEIVASNFGWPKIADGEFESYRSPCLAVRNKDIAVETCKRTNNALLVAYMHRRTWLQATSVHYTGFTPEMDKRQTTTLGFAAEPTAEHLQQMESDGVTWYVVDRSTTDRTNWEPYATVRYTNDSFYVLELNTSD
jgi:hypothetical protein